MRDEVPDPALVVKLLGLPAGALVRKDDAEAAGEEGGLAQALQKRRGVELGLLEHLGIGKERDRRPRLVLARDSDRDHLRRGLPARELLAVDLLVATDLCDEPFGERVDHRHADTVEPARDLVAVAAELPAGVELGETTVSAGMPCSGITSTGIPAPASETVTELSGWIVTSTESLRPARASSTALSTTSYTRW